MKFLVKCFSTSLTLIIILLVVFTFPAVLRNREEIKVFVDGLPVSTDTTCHSRRQDLCPFHNSRSAKYKSNRDIATQTVEATYGENLVRLQIDNKNAWRNGGDCSFRFTSGYYCRKDIDTAALFSEAFNYEVLWDAATYRVDIISCLKEMNVIGFMPWGTVKPAVGRIFPQGLS